MKALVNAKARSGGTEEYHDDLQDPDVVITEGPDTELDIVNVNVTGNDDNIHQKGILIQWENCRNGRFLLVPMNYKIPYGITLSNLFCIFFNGDRKANIPPYQMLIQKDLHKKSDKTNLSMMKRLMKEAMRGAIEIVGRSELIRHRRWNQRKALDFYEGVKHLFEFPDKPMGNGQSKRRRHSQLSWKRIFTILQKRQYRLMGE